MVCGGVVVGGTDRLEKREESLEKKDVLGWCGDPLSPYAPPALPPRDRVCPAEYILLLLNIASVKSKR